MEEFDGVGDPLTFGVGQITTVVPVVFHGRAYVEAPAGVFCPGPSLAGSVMDGDLAAWWAKWCLVVVKVAVYQDIGR